MAAMRKWDILASKVKNEQRWKKETKTKRQQQQKSKQEYKQQTFLWANTTFPS